MKIEKIISLASKVARVKYLGHKIPLKVTFHITYGCQLECPFCYRKKIVASELTTGQIKEMMREFKEMGTDFWIFNGGEALLRDDLGELIEYAKEMNFSCGLVTNGAMLAQRLSLDRRFQRLDFVQLSLDGSEVVHDALRGQGVFRKIIQALELLKTLNIKINLLSIIMKNNIQCIDDLVRIARRYSASFAFQPPVFHEPVDEQLKCRYLPDETALRGLAIDLLREKVKNYPMISCFEYLKKIRDFWPHPIKGLVCYASRLYCNITPDGYVVPCCSRLTQVERDNSGLLNGFRRAFMSLKDNSACSDCYFFGPQEFNISVQKPTLDKILF
jgi:MoaA/NifB/PqqE/SkfB family radical SAM enzyme